jgi:hypothetical protein
MAGRAPRLCSLNVDIGTHDYKSTCFTQMVSKAFHQAFFTAPFDRLLLYAYE